MNPQDRAVFLQMVAKQSEMNANVQMLARDFREHKDYTKTAFQLLKVRVRKQENWRLAVISVGAFCGTVAAAAITYAPKAYAAIKPLLD